MSNSTNPTPDYAQQALQALKVDQQFLAKLVAAWKPKHAKYVKRGWSEPLKAIREPFWFPENTEDAIAAIHDGSRFEETLIRRWIVEYEWRMDFTLMTQVPSGMSSPDVLSVIKNELQVAGWPASVRRDNAISAYMDMLIKTVQLLGPQYTFDVETLVPFAHLSRRRIRVSLWVGQQLWINIMPGCAILLSGDDAISGGINRHSDPSKPNATKFRQLVAQAITGSI